MEISETILLDVRRLVAENLLLEIDEVCPEASFSTDLGGESIELLELKFHLERIYGVKIQVQELASLDVQLDERGCLTQQSVALLKGKYPFLKLDRFESQPMQRRDDFVTIEAIAGFVQMAVDGSPQNADNPGLCCITPSA